VEGADKTAPPSSAFITPAPARDACHMCATRVHGCLGLCMRPRSLRSSARPSVHCPPPPPLFPARPPVRVPSHSLAFSHLPQPTSLAVPCHRPSSARTRRHRSRSRWTTRPTTSSSATTDVEEIGSDDASTHTHTCWGLSYPHREQRARPPYACPYQKTTPNPRTHVSFSFNKKRDMGSESIPRKGQL
jgi:hypothetical protein